MILEGKMRLHRFAGIDPAEIVVPFTSAEIVSLGEDNGYWQRACCAFLGNSTTDSQKASDFSL